MKNVQQVFVGTQANNVAGTAPGAIVAGDFSVLDGLTTTTIATRGATTDFFPLCNGNSRRYSSIRLFSYRF